MFICIKVAQMTNARMFDVAYNNIQLMGICIGRNVQRKITEMFSF